MWQNVTVRASRPLIVTAPVINLIDSNTVRFEWVRPITLCPIKSYKLMFESVSPALLGHEFSVDIKHNLSESIVVSKFVAYTIYRVKLVSCVHDELADEEEQRSAVSDSSSSSAQGVFEKSCSESLSKQFQTSGKRPEGYQAPRARLVSPRAVSIEWPEPVFRNGQTLKYQLVRQQLMLNNKTEAIYLGSSLYFLDLNVMANYSYKYRVIFTNEFGSSMSDWSNEMRIEPVNDNNGSTVAGSEDANFVSFVNSDATHVKLRLNFDLGEIFFSKKFNIKGFR
jgi:hypothetical protein